MRFNSVQSKRKGSVMMLTAFLLVGLFAFVAFVIDVGYIVNARSEFQRTADASALAASMRLPDEGLARSTAKQVARDNIGIAGPELASSDVAFGVWDADTAKFNSAPGSGADLNAARVTISRTEVKKNPLHLFFGPLLNKRVTDVSATAIAVADRKLCGPFIGVQNIRVTGSMETDSFDSKKGPYSGATAKQHGSLCSDGPIIVGGSATIRGDARAGKGQKVRIGGAAHVTGNVGSRSKPLNLPKVDASKAASHDDNDLIPQKNGGKVIDPNGDLSLGSQDSLDLPAGTYYFKNVNLTGQATLNILGPVQIFVTGDFTKTGGAGVNVNSKQASDLQIYMTGGNVKLTGTDEFFGVIYAPNTDIMITGNVNFFGAIVGKTLRITGSGFAHYDESLKLGGVDLPQRATLVE